MRKIILFVSLCTVVIGTGCPKSMPKQPAIISDRLIQYHLAQYDRDLRSYECAAKGEFFNPATNGFDGCASGSVNLVRAGKIRNETVHRLIRMVDYNYFEFENDLYVKRASGSFLADITDLGANFAATITNGERAKTIINAAIIAFRGGRKSGSIHYFQEQTADALISSMQSSRNRVLAELLTQLRDNDADSYSLDAALGDIIRYFYAGTLPRALQELKQNASIAAKNTKEEIRILKGISPSSPATRDDEIAAVGANDALQKLFNDVTSDSPESVKTAALAKLQSIAEQIKNDKTITDQMNADPMLTELLAKLSSDDAKDGGYLAQAIWDIRYYGFANHTLKQTTLDKINSFIVKAANKK